jgi:multidrug efflux pump subunit AcrB
MTPIALKLGEGSGYRAQMAATVICGLLTQECRKNRPVG